MTANVIGPVSRSEKIRTRIAAVIAAILIASAIFALRQLFLQGQAPMLDRIRDQGVLIVATRRAPMVYLAGSDGPDGFEYQLTQRFAATLNIDVRSVFPSTLEEMIHATATGEVHLAAAGLTATDRRTERLAFSEPYRTVTETLVYRRDDPKPASLADIAPGQLHVVRNSSHEETLTRALATHHEQLRWHAHSEVNSRRLLSAVDRGEFRYTVADSNVVAFNRRIFPRIATAFELGEPVPIAWAFARSGDDSLRTAANRFLRSLEANGELRQLRARYFGHTDRMN